MSILPEGRKFKEIVPSHLAGNKFAAKPPEQRLSERIYIDITATDKKKLEQAAKKAKARLHPWLRQQCISAADTVLAEGDNNLDCTHK